MVVLVPADNPGPEVAPATLPTAVAPNTTQAQDPASSFVVSFRVAIDARDVPFLIERLHPVVLDAYGFEACRVFVEQEILELRNYRQTGEAIGPIIRAFATADGSTTTQTYEVPVAFDFQGQHYEDEALLGLSGEVMAWFAECR